MTTARTARFDQTGGPDVIRWEDATLPEPGLNEVLFKTAAAGLNYIDTYHRRGIYPVPLPSGLGLEASGKVLRAGADSGFAEGDRVATFGPALGAYATHRIVAADSLFRVPDDVDDATAAAVLLKGCTAEFLAERVTAVRAGDDVLVHAAAGGVGLILVQWLTAMGARVIGTVSTEAKAAAAREAGAADIVFYTREDTAVRVREVTGGAGVRVVYDGVGADTWEASLDSCGRRGIIVSYGNASAPVTGVNLGLLAMKGSFYNTRPTLFDYYARPGERATGIERLWAMLREDKVRVTIGQRYPLEDAARAHEELEARRTTGSTVLMT